MSDKKRNKFTTLDFDDITRLRTLQENEESLFCAEALTPITPHINIYRSTTLSDWMQQNSTFDERNAGIKAEPELVRQEEVLQEKAILEAFDVDEASISSNTRPEAIPEKCSQKYRTRGSSRARNSLD